MGILRALYVRKIVFSGEISDYLDFGIHRAKMVGLTFSGHGNASEANQGRNKQGIAN